MAELQRKSLCPRLIDYLAIVGVRQTTMHRSGGGGGGGSGGNTGGNNASNSSPAVQVYLNVILYNNFKLNR